MNQVFLTFDVEDFINPASTKALEIILEMLKEHNLKALFFITGHMAEKLSTFPDIIGMLKAHEIGYHSSSHSVRPIIPEYTDTENYTEAYEKSIQRETSHINPLTGEIEGKGGIEFLKELFSDKKIVAYRAPGCCWSPPHMEAIRDLGIQFDFSSNLSPKPVFHKGITFYPYLTLGEWSGGKLEYFIVLRSILSQEYTLIDVHPNFIVYQSMWDYNYYNGNPKKLTESTPRSPHHVKSRINSFDLLLKPLCIFKNLKLAKITPALTKAQTNLNIDLNDFEKVYEMSVFWAKHYFKYEPKFLRAQFLKFFNLPNNH